MSNEPTEGINGAQETQDLQPEHTEGMPTAPPEGVQATEQPKAKRGRKAYPRDPDGRIIRPDGSVGRKTYARNSGSSPVIRDVSVDEIASDANVGKSINAIYSAVGLFRGPHWRLMQQEQKANGEVFGPLVRLYGEDAVLKKLVPVLLSVPVMVETLMPRIAIERGIIAGEIEKDKARQVLLTIKGMQEAEAQLDIAKQAKEQEEFLRNQVDIGIKIAGAAVAEGKS